MNDKRAKEKRIGIIGVGNIGMSILRGLLAADADTDTDIARVTVSPNTFLG